MKELLLIILYVSVAKAGCPSVCSCTENAVLCINKEIECIPSFESLIVVPSVIDLSGNEINIVDYDDFSFDASVHVIEIYLNNSNILDIDPRAFNEVIKLQQLYLQSNELSDIPENLVEGNKDLVLLNLSDNRFSTMPKMISKSLEVLALANSKISTVPSDSLEQLPNIKRLILQQNNIQHISVDMFKNANNFFFTTLTYNAWNCNCKTIDLFEYLVNKKYVDREEPVYCLSEEKNFINIYENGIIEKYKDQCGLNSDRDELFSGSLIKTDNEIIKGDLKQTSNLIEIDEETPIVKDIETTNNVTESVICEPYSLSKIDLSLVFILTILIVMCSFIMGYYVGKSKKEYIMGSTDSKFKLILP